MAAATGAQRYCWDTGTSSATLALISATKRLGLMPIPALKSGQTLTLVHKVATLAGESGLCQFISVVPAKQNDFAWGYAELSGTAKPLLGRKKYWEQAMKSPKNYSERHIGSYLLEIIQGVYRLLELNLVSAKEEKQLKDHLIEIKEIFSSPESVQKNLNTRVAHDIKEEGRKEFESLFQNAIDNFDRVKIQFTSEERDLIENPFPIVFRIVTSKQAYSAVDTFGLGAGKPGEYVFEDSLILGEDITEIQVKQQQEILKIQAVVMRCLCIAAPIQVKLQEIRSPLRPGDGSYPPVRESEMYPDKPLVAAAAAPMEEDPRQEPFAGILIKNRMGQVAPGTSIAATLSVFSKIKDRKDIPDSYMECLDISLPFIKQNEDCVTIKIRNDQDIAKWKDFLENTFSVTSVEIDDTCYGHNYVLQLQIPSANMKEFLEQFNMSYLIVTTEPSPMIVAPAPAFETAAPPPAYVTAALVPAPSPKPSPPVTVDLEDPRIKEDEPVQETEKTLLSKALSFLTGGLFLILHYVAEKFLQLFRLAFPFRNKHMTLSD